MPNHKLLTDLFCFFSLFLFLSNSIENFDAKHSITRQWGEWRKIFFLKTFFLWKRPWFLSIQFLTDVKTKIEYQIQTNRIFFFCLFVWNISFKWINMCFWCLYFDRIIKINQPFSVDFDQFFFVFFFCSTFANRTISGYFLFIAPDLLSWDI